MSADLKQLQKSLNYDKTFSCVQCGYCLPVCPTYLTMEKETHSPRGRINLVKMAAEGKLSDLSQLQEPIDLCLGCRACEVACPTGVEYGAILEGAKQTLEQRKTYSKPVKFIRKNGIRAAVSTAKADAAHRESDVVLPKKSGLRRLARQSGIMKALPGIWAILRRFFRMCLRPGSERLLLRDFSRPEGENTRWLFSRAA